MAKTRQPLHILADASMAENDEIRDLIAKGHVVEYLSKPYDLVIGKTCWRYVEKMTNSLTMALVSSKNRKYKALLAEDAPMETEDNADTANEI